MDIGTVDEFATSNVEYLVCLNMENASPIDNTIPYSNEYYEACRTALTETVLWGSSQVKVDNAAAAKAFLDAGMPAWTNSFPHYFHTAVARRLTQLRPGVLGFGTEEQIKCHGYRELTCAEIMSMSDEEITKRGRQCQEAISASIKNELAAWKEEEFWKGGHLVLKSRPDETMEEFRVRLTREQVVNALAEIDNRMAEKRAIANKEREEAGDNENLVQLWEPCECCESEPSYITPCGHLCERCM